VYPILFHVGPITVYSFGVLMAIGFYVGAFMTVNEYRRRGNDGEAMWNFVVWIFVAGLVGSRIFSIFNDLDAFFRDPLRELVSGSGFVWYGGLIGGFVAAWFLRKPYKMSFPTILDCTAVGLPIGQAIGRIGCHVAGDGDWGTVTNLPWGVAYKNAIIGWYYDPGVRVHPTPLYEAAAYTLVFLVLLAVRRRNLPTGTLFAIYLIGTSTARFFVEFIRLNPKVAGGLTEAQIIAIVLFTGAVLWLVKNRSAFRITHEAHS
jgi:phosphatidylglycerol:prolipoprotein diacylglycerol transferase